MLIIPMNLFVWKNNNVSPQHDPALLRDQINYFTKALHPPFINAHFRRLKQTKSSVCTYTKLFHQKRRRLTILFSFCRCWRVTVTIPRSPPLDNGVQRQLIQPVMRMRANAGRPERRVERESRMRREAGGAWSRVLTQWTENTCTKILRDSNVRVSECRKRVSQVS